MRAPATGAAETRPGAGTRRRPGGIGLLLLMALSVGVALFVDLPLVYIFYRGLEDGLRPFLDVVATGRAALLLGRTLLLVVGVSATAALFGVTWAWLVARTDLPGRRGWAVVGAMPLVFPSYVAAFALVAFLGPRGQLQGWLEPLGVERLPDLVYGYGGALVALAFFQFPYVYLLALARLRRLDPALEEASRSLGRGRWTTFFRVVLPAMRPAAAGGTLLVALYTVSDFGAVSITRYDTFTLAIYTAYQTLFDRTVAAGLAVLLVVLTLLLVLLDALEQRRGRPLLRRAQRRAPPIPLGRWRWPSLLFTGGIATVGVGIPLIVVVTWGLRGLWLGTRLGWSWQPMWSSLGVSAVAAVAAVALALPVAIWSVRHPSAPAAVVERLAYAGYALPGIVVALSLVFFAIRVARPLYQTLVLLVAAYLIRFLPQALSACTSALSAVSPSLEEAGRSLGRGPIAVLASITTPLVRPGLLAGAALVFLTTMKELPATLLLRPIGFDTLATEIWKNASEGFYADAAVPSLMLVGATVLPVWLLVVRPVLAERA